MSRRLCKVRVRVSSVLFCRKKANLKLTKWKWSTFVTNASLAHSSKGCQCLLFLWTVQTSVFSFLGIQIVVWQLKCTLNKTFRGEKVKSLLVEVGRVFFVLQVVHLYLRGTSKDVVFYQEVQVSWLTLAREQENSSFFVAYQHSADVNSLI